MHFDYKESLSYWRQNRKEGRDKTFLDYPRQRGHAFQKMLMLLTYFTANGMVRRWDKEGTAIRHCHT